VIIAPSLTLGVFGGMGPAASAQFMHDLAVAVPACRDQDHPRVIMLSDPRVPDRTQAILDGSDAPLAPIRAGLLTLASWGADLLAVPCNTAHVFVDTIAGELPVPLVHIVDATLAQAAQRSPDGAWLAATTGTVTSGLYQRKAAAIGYRLRVPDPAIQEQIHETALLVKANHIAAAADRFTRAMSRLWALHDLAIITACTELPIAYSATELPADRNISSLQALANACVAQLYTTEASNLADGY
jgi:aspartate racemase